MIQRNGKNLLKTLTALLLAALLAGAFAQELDPRGVALLEGLGSGEVPEDIRNMVLSTTSVTHMEGQEFETTSRTIIDYENQRAAIVQEVMGMETRMLYVDGKMSMNVMGMNMPMPPGTEEAFASIFEEQTADNLVESATRITFDGQVNYGDLLVGDQVTYEGDAGVYGTPESPVMHYVFDGDGALLGMHIPAQDGAMLMVFDQAITDSIISYDARVYLEQAGEWTLLQESTRTELEYNVELDESLFQ